MLLESLWDFRFRIDKVTAVPTARNRKIGTIAPMEFGTAATDDGDKLRVEGDQRIVDPALEGVYKGTGKGKWSFGTGSELE